MLSVLAEFDDIHRCQTVLNEAASETQEEFLRFLNVDQERQQQLVGAVQEAERLQRELDASLQNMATLETKLFHARRLLEMETKARRDAESERDQVEKKIVAVADLVLNTDIQKDTREKLEFLKSYPKKRKSMNVRIDEKYGNDINSTGSFLSDLSVTQSEEDFLDLKSSRTWSKRPSKTRSSKRVSAERRRSNNNSTKTTNYYAELGKNDIICATTKVSIPQSGNGPIIAESIIEAVPEVEPTSSSPTEPTTATATITTSTSSGDVKTTDDDQENQNIGYPKRSPQKFRSPFKTNYFTPTAPLQSQNSDLSGYYQSAPSKFNNIKRSVLRCHLFSSKTFIKSDTCTHCQKKIRFGSVALKCKNCRAVVHQDCRELLTLSCVPPTAGGTPTFKSFMGYVTDYAPSVSPMIPAIIIHCVHEIEMRGLNEIGIYRVSGSEREVKLLKEKFMRGKSVPYLSNMDIHVLCGCVKDFLRSLREPLIPTDLWKDFSNATQNYDDDQKIKDFYESINKLPQANRDTLAFLMLHFQRIAECVEIKMPIENIARVFGPTIVGYSSSEPDQHAIFTETMIQIQVMSNLMNIPGTYWSQFTAQEYDCNRPNQQPPETPKKVDMTVIYSTPLKSTLKKDRKFYATPPYSYKKNKS